MADPIKTFMQQNVTIPLNIEASLPKGVPSVSGIMSSIAQALPENPLLSGSGLGGKSLPSMTGFTDIIKGVESALPQGVPGLSGVLSGSPYRSVATEVKDEPTKGGILRGGYRSLST